MKIKCTCPCGAEFEAEGDVVNTGIRYREFLEAHKVCLENKKEIQTVPFPYPIYPDYPRYSPWTIGSWDYTAETDDKWTITCGCGKCK